MITGIDISHHNTPFSVLDKSLYSGIDFCISKASEGATMEDENFHGNVKYARSIDVIPGAYHYARPEYNNDPNKEAANFLDMVIEHIQDGLLLALDWEGKALSFDDSWAVQWLQRVEYETGIRPFIYCSRAYLHKLPKVAMAGYPLWLARYNNVAGTTTPFDNWTIWQYTSSPLDRDRFDGTREMLEQYAKSKQERQEKPVFVCPHFRDCEVVKAFNKYIKDGTLQSI